MDQAILIVGAGPTGLTAALELSRFGVPVRLIDKLPDPPTTSRAIGVQARTLELLAQRGLAESLVRRGNPSRAGSVYGGGKLVFRLDFEHIESPYNYILFVSQAQTEGVLREAVERQGVRIERGVELIALSQGETSRGAMSMDARSKEALSHDASPVTAVLRHSDGRIEEFKTSWLISAEGSHSVVRTTLDLAYEGKTLDEQYALGDLYLEGELADTEFHIFSSVHGFMALFPLGRRHFRLIASHPFSAPEKGTAPSLEELQRIYDQRSHLGARLHDMSWSSWFRINSRMVPRLRIGRLFLGGDAAHIHSPAGAQGMNTGIQDMVNLCWKLALVVKGQASVRLLDTYEQDRLPVMRNVLFKTESLTDLIGSENPVVRSLFNHLGPFVGGARLVQENSTAQMSQLALGYRDSPLSVNPMHAGSIHAGDRMPDLRVRHRVGGVLKDSGLLGLLDPRRFVLLIALEDATSATDIALADVTAGWGDVVRVVEVVPGAGKADRVAYEAALGVGQGVYLVRPDGYVAVAATQKVVGRELLNFHTRWLAAGAEASAR